MAKAIAFLTTSRNSGVEYAVSESRTVFSREGFFDDRYKYWTKTKWAPMPQHSYLSGVASEILKAIDSEMKTLAIGFATDGHHLIMTEKLKLRLPAIQSVSHWQSDRD